MIIVLAVMVAPAAVLVGAVIVLRRWRKAQRLAAYERERRVQAEEARLRAERVSAAKDQFLATMSHEFRTPLNALIGYAEMFDYGIFGHVAPKQREAVARMLQCGRHIGRLVEDVLDVVRLNAGVLPVAPEPLLLDDVMQRALVLVQPQADAKSILMIAERESDPVICVADRHRLCQIVVNLVANAVKFTPENGEVHVEWGAGPDAVHVRVRDTGIGIAPEDQGRIFVAFERLPSGASAGASGTGLGLTISKHLAHSMGGDITVESRPGAGASFTLSLPVDAGVVAEASATAPGLEALVS